MQRFLKSLSPSPRSVFLCVAMDRETRERWSLLSVETEANRDSWSTYEMIRVGSLGSFIVPLEGIFGLPCLL
jgi:hypothetical protein